MNPDCQKVYDIVWLYDDSSNLHSRGEYGYSPEDAVERYLTRHYPDGHGPGPTPDKAIVVERVHRGGGYEGVFASDVALVNITREVPPPPAATWKATKA